jgi:hypothetical protein
MRSMSQARGLRPATSNRKGHPVSQNNTKVRLSFSEVQALTSDERYSLAATTYETFAQADPRLEEQPGRMASLIADETGLDFSTAAIVALSAPTA